MRNSSNYVYARFRFIRHNLHISVCEPSGRKKPISDHREKSLSKYCWFASDVTAAMLGVKNKSVSLRWEMISTLMQILPKRFFCIDHQHDRLVTWLQTKNRKGVQFLACGPPLRSPTACLKRGKQSERREAAVFVGYTIFYGRYTKGVPFLS